MLVNMSCRRGSARMGLFKKFSAPKARITLELNEVTYDYKDKLTGRIILEPQENIAVDGFRLEFSGSKKVKWKKGLRSVNSTFPLEIRKIPIGGAVKLQKGQRYEQPFQIDIPLYPKPDPFTENKVKIKGVVVIKDRPDLTCEVKPVINFPYVIECVRSYGGCGFTTQPLSELVNVCPKCGSNLEDIWNRKYGEEAKAAAHEARKS